MKYAAALLQSDSPDVVFEQLLPGAHALVFGNVEASVRARKAGLYLRDTILILSAGPSQEFAFVFRKPTVEGTVAEQVVETGTGGLNVDACRVATVQPNPSIARRETARRTGHAPITGRKAHESEAMGRIDRRGSPEVYKSERPSEALGRWPPNLLLIHSLKCVPGTTRVEGHKGYKNGPGGSSSQFSQKGTPTTRTQAWAGHADEDGKETVPAWECVSGCPVPLLDATSGERRSAGLYPTTYSNGGGYTNGDIGKNMQGPLYDDAGGASRFFPQFASRDEAIEWLVKLILPTGALLFR